MTKKSRRGVKNSSCICSFISVFDFRIGWSTRKLISEQKQTDEIQSTDKVSVKDIVLEKDICFEDEEETGNSSDLAETVKEFVNELQKSSSKKELVSKILNDLSSFKEGESKNRNLFGRKHKSRLETSNSNRIVLLKPGTSRMSSDLEENKKGRFSSQFSFTEIKKRLKQAIRKERNRIPYQRLVDISEKNNIGKGNLGWNSPTRDHFFHERFVMPAFGSNSNKEQDKTKSRKLMDREGQKRLSEIILMSGEDEIAKLSSQEHDGILGSSETLPRLKIDLFVGRQCQTPDVSETEHRRTGDDDADQNCYQKMDLFEEDQSLLTYPKTVDVLHSSSMRQERLSPISVLDSIIVEDDTVSPPTSKSTEKTDPAVEPRRISFEETVICLGTHLADEESAFEYVEAVLLASDLNWDEFLSRWISSDPILDSSLFHEVELFSSRSLHEQKVLFDCTNEILEDVCEHYFSRYPNVLRRVPTGEDVIQEVWNGVDCNLSWATPSTTLDDMVKRDMEKNTKWMNLVSEIENVGMDIEEIILEQLVEDIILCIPNEVVTPIE